MKSYWIDSVKKKEKYESLNGNIETDICIIGGGLTGLQIAYYLSKYKIRNVILEKDRICSKTSGYSTAKITSQHGLFYKYLIDSKGTDFAKKYYEANENAIDNIEKIIKEEKIDCGFERQPSYVFTEKSDYIQKIKDEVEAVRKIGGKANYIQAKDIKINNINIENNNRIKALCAIEFENQAEFNPYKYGLGLAKICANRQTEIYENSKAVDIKKEEGIYIVTLDNGFEVRAKYVVMATKYPFLNFPGFHFLKMYQSTSNVIVVDTKEELFEGMYINSENPTISLRVINDENKKLLEVAGFDHKTGSKIDLKNSYKYLEEKIKSMYPDMNVIYRWNTQDCISLDKIAYIGEFSNLMPKLYVATGYNKWGNSTSNIAANIIFDKIMGKENKYEQVYKATRLEPIKNIKEVGNMLKESVYSLALNKMKIPKENLDQIQNGSGGIIEINGKKVGVYKNGQGEIFKVKPICQHLGCELSWNNLDNTWDCPCHGSRYNYKGKLIYGPTVKDLEEY